MLWGDEKSKNQKINWDPKKLSYFKNEGKPAFIEPNFNAATSHFRTKFIKSKLKPLQFRGKVVLYKNSVKWGSREQSKHKVSYFLLEIKQNSGSK